MKKFWKVINTMATGISFSTIPLFIGYMLCDMKISIIAIIIWIIVYMIYGYALGRIMK